MAVDTEVSKNVSILRRPRRRWARGSSRPEYLQPGDVDQLMIMFIALMSEVSSLRDRIDTHESLALLGKMATPEAVENFRLSPKQREEREEGRQAMLKRVLRVMFEDLEAAQDGLN